MSKSNSDETKKQKSFIQFRTEAGVFLIFSIWKKKHIVTISLNCYLETFIQNKQNLLFLYFCKIVQAYIQQSNWLLVQNCPNIHQTQDIWRRSGVYRWCHMVLRAPPIQAPSITLLGEEMPRKLLYFWSDYGQIYDSGCLSLTRTHWNSNDMILADEDSSF